VDADCCIVIGGARTATNARAKRPRIDHPNRAAAQTLHSRWAPTFDHQFRDICSRHMVRHAAAAESRRQYRARGSERQFGPPRATSRISGAVRIGARGFGRLSSPRIAGWHQLSRSRITVAMAAAFSALSKEERPTSRCPGVPSTRVGFRPRS